VLETDYIMRIVAQLGEALGRIRGLAREGKVDAAKVELDSLARTLAGLDLESLARVPVSVLVTLLPEPERRALAARLLKEYGDLLAMGDPAAAPPVWKKAFTLYDDLLREGLLPDDEATAAAFSSLVARLS
jgi:hypothetical protein